MSETSTTDLRTPVVLILAGHDPTGGAGIAADNESIISQGCQPVSILTCATVQDTHAVYSIDPLEPQLILQQARAILEDMPIDSIKLGLLPTEDIIVAAHELIADYPKIPVVCDPIINAGGNGKNLLDIRAVEAIRELLLPYVTVLTPNTQEAMRLAPEADSPHTAARALMELGCGGLLLTGTHQNTERVINRFYHCNSHNVHTYDWPRLPHTYHGSGCTLASALAALLAQDVEIDKAIEEAQAYTWHSLQFSYRLGMGQWHPNRFFWVAGNEQNNDDNSSLS